MRLAEPRHTESHSRLLKSCAFLPSYQQQSITIHGLEITKLRHYGDRGFLPGEAEDRPLTSADALERGGAGAEVALQPLGVVAGLRPAAVLVQLLGADLAAAAAVRHQPHARGALRHGRRALAHGGAGRAQSLRSGAEQSGGR